MQRRSLSAAWLVAITTLVVVCGRAPAQQQGSVMAQVLGRLDSRRLAQGASFFVKTTSASKLGPCGLPGGATLEGRVASVKWKGSGVKREEMALRFLPIPCSGDETQELIPILVAMQGPHSDPREEFIAQQELVNALSSAVRRVALHGGQAEGDVPVKVNAELLGSVDHVVPVHSAREGLVLQLLLHARDLHIVNGPGRLHQSASSEEAGEFVAGEEHLIQVRDPRSAGVFGVSHDGLAQLRRPAAFL